MAIIISIIVYVVMVQIDVNNLVHDFILVVIWASFEDVSPYQTGLGDAASDSVGQCI